MNDAQLPARFEDQLEAFAPQFKAALPAHIPVERFKRVVVTALNQTPALAQADRRSLFNSCIKAAQDGLYPDGREAALVIFNTKVQTPDGDKWEKRVQYMPMVAGVRKRMRNSGEVDSAEAHVVYAKDHFRFALGDAPHIEHKPVMLADRGEPVGAYAIIKLKNGEVLREVMSKAEIEKVRKVSRSAEKGPWVEWWEEMARKTVLRRCAKSAPMQADLDVLLKRDEDLEPDEPQIEPRPTREPIREVWDLASDAGEIIAEHASAETWCNAFGALLTDPAVDHVACWSANLDTVSRLPRGTQATLQDVYDQRERQRQSFGTQEKRADSTGLPGSGHPSAEGEGKIDSRQESRQQIDATARADAAVPAPLAAHPVAFALVDDKGEAIYQYAATQADAEKYFKDLDATCAEFPELWAANKNTIVQVANDFGLKRTAMTLGAKYKAQT